MHLKQQSVIFIITQVNWNCVTQNVLRLRDKLLDDWAAFLATCLAFNIPRDAEQGFIGCQHKRYRTQKPLQAPSVIGKRNNGSCNKNSNLIQSC